MGEFTSYIVQSAIVMTILYLGYKLFLARTTFYRFNRVVLLVITLVSWLTPWLLTIFEQSIVNVQVLLPRAMDFGTAIPAEATAGETSFSLTKAVIYVYIAGLAAATLFSIYAYARMCNLIRASKSRKCGNTRIIVSDKAPAPFSWFKYIVVRQSDCDSDLKYILKHEMAHISSAHFIDIIISQLTIILQWFSPAAWLMKRELRSVHEFEADRTAVGNENPYKYQMMLLKKAVGTSFPSIANSLNQSQINIRITMMLKRKSNGMQRASVLMLPALLSASAALLSNPFVANAFDKLSTTTLSTQSHAPGRIDNDKVSNYSVIKQTFDAASGTGGEMSATEKYDSDNDVAISVEKTAKFKGGQAELFRFISKNLKFPDGVELTKSELVVVQFIINIDGTISDIRIMKGASNKAFDYEAIRVVNLTNGLWEPAKNGGNPVASRYAMPFRFKPK